MEKKLKRKIKLQGRKICHGTTENCLKLVKFGQHRSLGKKTAKGTKIIKKKKKVYKVVKD